MLAVLRVGVVANSATDLCTGKCIYYIININMSFRALSAECFNVADYFSWSCDNGCITYDAVYSVHVQVSTFSTASFSGWTKKRKTVSVPWDIIFGVWINVFGVNGFSLALLGYFLQLFATLGILTGGTGALLFALDYSVKASELELHPSKNPWSHSGFFASLDHSR
jgi:hypothetical protein